GNHRRSHVTARREPADMAWLVVTHVHAHHDVRREADEPHVLLVVGGAGLARDRLADRTHDGGGATLHHAFHHRRDLIGGHRIDHLPTPVDQRRLRLIVPLVSVATATLALIVLVHRAAVAILDTVDESRNDPLAAVVEHGIRGD